MRNLLGKEVRLWLRVTNYQFSGVVLDDNDSFLTIESTYPDNYGQEVVIHKEDISLLKVIRRQDGDRGGEEHDMGSKSYPGEERFYRATRDD